jgi:hypothetical protein
VYPWLGQREWKFPEWNFASLAAHWATSVRVLFCDWRAGFRWTAVDNPLNCRSDHRLRVHALLQPAVRRARQGGEGERWLTQGILLQSLPCSAKPRGGPNTYMLNGVSQILRSGEVLLPIRAVASWISHNLISDISRIICLSTFFCRLLLRDFLLCRVHASGGLL